MVVSDCGKQSMLNTHMCIRTSVDQGKRLEYGGQSLSDFVLLDIEKSRTMLKARLRKAGTLAILVFSYLILRGVGVLPIACAAAGKQATPARTYTTQFSATENPISEGGNWTNGKAVGLDWADVATVPGLAYGTESGGGGYDDSTAILTGTWGADQTAQATVHSVNQNDNIYEEVELRLRSAISAHKNTGYEINFRCSKTGNAYTQIVRWNGKLGDFTYLSSQSGSKYGVAEGDVVKASIVGNKITVYINGVQVNQATDSTFPGGSPGIGFFISGASGVNQDYGFTNFTATDGTQAPAPPANLTGSPH